MPHGRSTGGRSQRWVCGRLSPPGSTFGRTSLSLGGADAGVYVNLGANIARTGAILIHDPTLAALDPSLYPSLLRPLPPGELTPYYLMPAFYVPATPAGLIIPQFYPLHPVWQAVAYALGGLRAELLMTPLWGFLGALAVYFTTRRLWGWRAGMLALAALSVTALQVWFARYPTTEMLTQYLLWTGVWALIAWMDKQEPRGLWAGARRRRVGPGVSDAHRRVFPADPAGAARHLAVVDARLAPARRLVLCAVSSVGRALLGPRRFSQQPVLLQHIPLQLAG